MSTETDPVDLTDPDVFVPGVPHATFEHLRRHDPVSWRAEADGPGYWSVTRHADVTAVNRDHRRFSSARRGAQSIELSEESLAQQRLMLVNMDPPRHTRYRMLVSKGFTARTVRSLEASVRRMTTAIVDRMCEAGACDAVTDIAAELPLQVIAELLGVPPDDRHMVLGWSNRLMASDDPEYNVTPEAVEEAATELYAYFDSLAGHRAVDPRDDLVSTLVQADIDGERLSELELSLFFLLLSVAGNETTRNLIAHGIVALADHPWERQRLIDDPSLMPGAVEEMLRWGSPIMQFRRTATTDTTVAGRRIAEGDKVLLWYISANRDETVFSDPYRFDVGRSPNDHVSFGGGGPHHCLGAHLARLEARIMFEELLGRLADLERCGPVVRVRSNMLNGLKHAPIRFAPRSPT